MYGGSGLAHSPSSFSSPCLNYFLQRSSPILLTPRRRLWNSLCPPFAGQGNKVVLFYFTQNLGSRRIGTRRVESKHQLHQQMRKQTFTSTDATPRLPMPGSRPLPVLCAMPLLPSCSVEHIAICTHTDFIRSPRKAKDRRGGGGRRFTSTVRTRTPTDRLQRDAEPPADAADRVR